MERKLFRSEKNKMLCGVCGGLGEYFNVDPTIIRLIVALFSCAGPGIIFYIAAALIVPKNTYI